MSAEKFFVYFLLIAFYAVYAELNGGPEQVNTNRGQAVASMPAPNTSR